MRSILSIIGAAVLISACGGGGSGSVDGAPGSTIDGSLRDSGTRDGSSTIIDSGPRADSGSVIIETDAGPKVCYLITCNGKLLECGNCIDDDGDGLIDSDDPECLGPCDNTEGPTLNAGVGGETGATCGADCYWDYGNGNGNDGCLWDYRCDPLAPKDRCNFDPNRAAGAGCPSNQPEMCQDFCGQLTPNGCDCFGCCTFPELAGQGPGGTDGHVWIGSVTNGGAGTCTFADVQNPDLCPPCTPQPSCYNDCQECELCIGKPTVPDHCLAPVPGPDGGAPPSQQCPTGIQPCGLPGQAACGPGLYCISGCCRVTVD